MCRSTTTSFLGWVVVLLFAVGCHGEQEGAGPKGPKAAAQTPPIGMVLAPEQAILSMGSTLAMGATGLYDDRVTRDLTNAVVWHVSDDSIASISNGLDREGVLTPNTVGVVEVWATLGEEVSPATRVEVTDAVVDAISVEPTSVRMAAGSQTPLTATAFFSDGAISDATGQVRWVVSDTSVVRLESDNTLVGLVAGNTEVHAIWGDVSSPRVPVDVVEGAKPDLSVSSISGFVGDEGAEISIVLRNDGDVSATDFWVDVWVDPSWDPVAGDIGDGYERVPYLAPGDSLERVLTVADLSAGRHEVLVVVDLESEVEESNEQNNRLSMELVVEAASTAPSRPADLSVDWFTYIADATHVYYWVEIVNDGDETAGPFWVDIFVDEYSSPGFGVDGDDWVEVDGLAPGEKVEVDVLVETYCAWCWSWIVVDSADDVDESDESNNVEGPLDVFSETY